MVTTNPINNPQLTLQLQLATISKLKEITIKLYCKHHLRRDQLILLKARKERKGKSNRRLSRRIWPVVTLQLILAVSNHHPVQPFNQSKWHRRRKIVKTVRTSSKALMQKRSGTWRLCLFQRKPIVLPNSRQVMMSRAAMRNKTKMERIKLLSIKKRVPTKTTLSGRVWLHRRSNSQRLVKHFSSLKSILKDFSSLAHLEYQTAVIKTLAVPSKFAWLTQRRKLQMTFLRNFWWRRFKKRTRNANLSKREAKAKPRLILISRESD